MLRLRRRRACFRRLDGESRKHIRQRDFEDVANVRAVRERLAKLAQKRGLDGRHLFVELEHMRAEVWQLVAEMFEDVAEEVLFEFAVEFGANRILVFDELGAPLDKLRQPTVELVAKRLPSNNFDDCANEEDRRFANLANKIESLSEAVEALLEQRQVGVRRLQLDVALPHPAVKPLANLKLNSKSSHLIKSAHTNVRL